MIEYYLAKKAQQSPEFLSQIMSDRNYLNYTNELLYFTGLNRQNKEIVSVLQEYTGCFGNKSSRRNRQAH